VTKLLHPLGNKPLIMWVADACEQVGISRLVFVLGHQGERIREVLGQSYEYVEQLEALGTGHALMQARELLTGWSGDLVVLAGDAPFVRSDVIAGLVAHHRETGSKATILTGRLKDPGAYGRIVRDNEGKVTRIVEARDASPRELEIKEVNSAAYCFDARAILPLLDLIGNDNEKGEYLLTDVIWIAWERDLAVETFVSPDPNVVRGVNTEEDFRIARDLLTRDAPPSPTT
jgi:bifunctional UDP-N-acetylglucosamine pyrophosphorylase/glucosamine-1-phosphate N-acetyltransferase